MHFKLTFTFLGYIMNLIFKNRMKLDKNKLILSFNIKFWSADHKTFEDVLCTQTFILHSVSLTCTLKLHKKGKILASM